MSTPPRRQVDQFGSLPAQGNPGAPSGQQWPAAGNQPLGAPPPPSVSIEQFRPRRTRWWVWLLGLLALVVAGALTAVALFANGLLPAPEPEPTPTSSPPEPTTAPDPQGSPWETASGSGYWRIVEQNRSGDALVLTMEITCDEGGLGWQIYAFHNDTTKGYDPVPSGELPDLAEGEISAGDAVTGYVTLEMPVGAATLILADKSGLSKAVSALPITP